MTARAGFGFETHEVPRFQQSRFGAKQNPNAPKRMPFADLTNHNETGFGHQEFHQQAQPQVLSRHVSRQDRYYDPPEKMFLPDPPRKYEGYRFEPSHDIWFEGEIELEPLPILREIQW